MNFCCSLGILYMMTMQGEIEIYCADRLFWSQVLEIKKKQCSEGLAAPIFVDLTMLGKCIYPTWEDVFALHPLDLESADRQVRCDLMQELGILPLGGGSMDAALGLASEVRWMDLLFRGTDLQERIDSSGWKEAHRHYGRTRCPSTGRVRLVAMWRDM